LWVKNGLSLAVPLHESQVGNAGMLESHRYTHPPRSSLLPSRIPVRYLYSRANNNINNNLAWTAYRVPPFSRPQREGTASFITCIFTRTAPRAGRLVPTHRAVLHRGAIRACVESPLSAAHFERIAQGCVRHIKCCDSCEAN
jgi:hypothetical protein